MSEAQKSFNAGDVAIFKELGLLTHQGKKILLVDVTDCSAP